MSWCFFPAYRLITIIVPYQIDVVNGSEYVALNPRTLNSSYLDATPASSRESTVLLRDILYILQQTVVLSTNGY